jgi:hypothetical protein
MKVIALHQSTWHSTAAEQQSTWQSTAAEHWHITTAERMAQHCSRAHSTALQQSRWHNTAAEHMVEHCSRAAEHMAQHYGRAAEHMAEQSSRAHGTAQQQSTWHNTAAMLTVHASVVHIHVTDKNSTCSARVLRAKGYHVQSANFSQVAK